MYSKRSLISERSSTRPARNSRGYPEILTYPVVNRSGGLPLQSRVCAGRNVGFKTPDKEPGRSQPGVLGLFVHADNRGFP